MRSIKNQAKKTSVSEQEEKIVELLSKCPHFSGCSQNLCLLDLELNLRSGGKQDKCRYMREPKVARINGREFVSGGGVMPNAPLHLVPSDNLKWLNVSSQARRNKLRANQNILPK